MSDPKQTFRVGVSVLVTDNKGQILLGQRKGASSPSHGWWSTPGGSVEWNETLTRTAQRELKEETGLWIPDRNRFLNIDSAEHFRFGKHYFMFYLTVAITDEEATRIKNAEPDKCNGWIWFFVEDVLLGALTPFTEPRTVIQRVFNKIYQSKK